MSKPVTPTVAYHQQPVQGGHGRQEGDRTESKGMERLEVGEMVLN